MAAPASALATILPPGAVAFELDEVEPDERFVAELHPEERAAVEGATERRIREFAGGRACARRALATLGMGARALPMGVDGAPLWPPGYVGSITHKGSYRAAAVAPARVLRAIGIDVEPDEPLPPGVLETIASDEEVAAVRALLAGSPGRAWDRLLFSAKESAVKAARGRGAAGVRSVAVALAGGSFTATLEGAEGGSLHGAWTRSGRMLLATTAVAAD